MNTEPENGHYIRPRIVVGLGIYALVAVLALFDAISVDYTYDNIVHHRHDRRRQVRRDVRKDVIAGGALFLTALGSAAASAFVLFGEAGSGLRGFAVALALGAFSGAGLVMATEEDANGEAPHDGRSKA